MNSGNTAVRACQVIVSMGLLASTFVRADGPAEPIPSFYQEPGLSKNRQSASNGNEHIDPFTGKLQWHYVDAYLPGNGGLDIKVQRSYSSLNETVHDYSPVGTGWTIHFGRVMRSNTVLICALGRDPSVNPILELPDGSRHTLYDSLDGPYAVSTDLWKATCTGSGGGGLEITSPDGTRYIMDVEGVQLPSGANRITSWYPSRIIDRNGNTLNLTYQFVSALALGVTSVSASDGRNVTFTYADGALKTVSTGNATWTYATSAFAGGYAGQFTLDSVTRPDGLAWRYTYNPPGSMPGMGTPGGFSMKRVVHPTGGSVDYTYGFYDFTFNIQIPVSTVVTRKQASNGDTWTYAYQRATQTLPVGQASWFVTASCDDHRLDCTVVEGPDGRYHYWHTGYGSVFSDNVYLIGTLAGKASSTKFEGQFYQTMTEGNYWDRRLVSNQANRRPGNTVTFDTQTYVPVLTSRGISRNGTNFTTAFGAFDAYGNPGSISETGTDARTTTVSYFTNPGKWILHVKKDESIGGVGDISRSFDANGNLTQESRFGVATSFAYTAEGDVLTKTDARGKVSTFTNYKRGIPQSESHPEGISISRTVSDAGNILSETDGAGSTTGYGYDLLNRITSITRALGNAVSVGWQQNSRTVTRGGYTETSTYDAFGRLIETAHAADNTSIRQTFVNDSLGRRVFASYPNDTKGTGYVLDIGGQLLSIYNGNLPNTTTMSSSRLFNYLGDTMEVRNERDKVFKYKYRMYSPEEKHLLLVEAPEAAANVTMTRNGLGQMLSATQDGKTRTYTYDAHHFLTQMNDPEVGNTIYGRDEVGNMITRQVGTSGITSYTYDGRNRVKNVDFPSGAPDVTRTYYGDDKLESMDNGIARRVYTYDANKNLKRETLAITGHAPFAIDYEYNANDALDAITYGTSGRKVTYAPDGFGRPTKAAPYVSAVTHHPNGQPATLQYANGVKTEIGLNARHWPETMRLTKSTATYSDQSYEYDELGNVWDILDTRDANYNRAMDYDGIDRVRTASGSWGTGQVQYDGRSNITSQTQGTNVLTYSYDPTTNRLNTVTGARNFSYSYDVYGNVTNNGVASFTYDDAQNMRCVNCGQAGEVAYDYDAGNMRVRSTRAGVPTYHVYAGNGNLMWEENAAGMTEFIYLHGKQVATRRKTN